MKKDFQSCFTVMAFMSVIRLAFLLVSFCSLKMVVSAVRDYHGYKLYRFRPYSINWLKQMEEHYHVNDDEILFDVWREPQKSNPNAEVLVAPEFEKKFLQILRQNDITDAELLRNDVQRDINRQNMEIKARRRRFKRSLEHCENETHCYDINSYHRYSDIQWFFQRLSEQYRNLTKLVLVAKSFENRDIIGIKIGTDELHSDKPAILIDAGVHSREWIAPAVAVWIAAELLAQYSKNEKIQTAVDTYDWYIVPVVNPDGYEYSMTKDRMWRKTRSFNTTITKWCIGVDGNRNWGHRWGENDASRNPCSHIYAGAGPFSEPEIAGMRDFVNDKIPHLQIYVTLHSFGQVIVSPWGYTTDRPKNYVEHKLAADAAVKAIREESGEQYVYGTIASLLYEASGTSVDYMQSRGVPYVYGIELRPRETDEVIAFALPPRFIEPTGREVLAGLLALQNDIWHKWKSDNQTSPNP